MTEAVAPIELGVSDFVALLNQTLEYAYPQVVVVGELANFRISKNKWVYFDLKDELASVKFFGSIYNLPGPLEDGMLLRVQGQPRLHSLYGFSVTVRSIQPTGEGTIKRAAQLLQAKLAAEGLFEESRKRSLPYPPTRIGLVTSAQSAAYADFIKILDARWQGIAVQLIDVQVQGEVAPEQISAALERFNSDAEPPEAIVIIRGGGSAEDLAAFNTELVTRAIAASRVPTLVAIGHEVDLSLAELAADRRASTPSNAAELLVPDRRHEQSALQVKQEQLHYLLTQVHKQAIATIADAARYLNESIQTNLTGYTKGLAAKKDMLQLLDPKAPLQRGYALVYDTAGHRQASAKKLRKGAEVTIHFHDGRTGATIK